MKPLTRKNFLKASLLSACALPLAPFSALAEAETRRKTVKIKDVKPYVFKRAIYVKIETDAGVSGWGEAAHDFPKLTAALIDEICKPELIGKDPFDSEALWMGMYFNGEDAGTTGLLPGGIAGVDNALWDLKGKLLNLPVHKLLGGTGVDRIQVYGSYGRSGGKSGQKNPAEMAATAAEFVQQGFRTVKARMQIRQLNINPDPDPTYDIVKAVRQAIGDDIRLFVDFNNGYHAAQAITLAKKLHEHFNVAAIEEPVSYQDYEGLSQVVAAVDIPVMAGEHEYNKWQMRDLIIKGKVDVINADVNKAGGISEMRKVAHVAEAFEKTIMVHNARPTLATAASLQLVASIPNAARIQEYGGKREDLGLSHLFDNYFDYKDGYLAIPTGPGLGLVVNEKAMEKHKLN